MVQSLIKQKQTIERDIEYAKQKIKRLEGYIWELKKKRDALG